MFTFPGQALLIHHGIFFHCKGHDWFLWPVSTWETHNPSVRKPSLACFVQLHYGKELCTYTLTIILITSHILWCSVCTKHGWGNPLFSLSQDTERWCSLAEMPEIGFEWENCALACGLNLTTLATPEVGRCQLISWNSSAVDMFPTHTLKKDGNNKAKTTGQTIYGTRRQRLLPGSSQITFRQYSLWL